MNIIEGQFGKENSDESLKIYERINNFLAQHIDEDSTGKFMLVIEKDDNDSEDQVLMASTYTLTDLNYVLDILKYNLLMGN